MLQVLACFKVSKKQRVTCAKVVGCRRGDTSSSLSPGRLSIDQLHHMQSTTTITITLPVSPATLHVSSPTILTLLSSNTKNIPTRLSFHLQCYLYVSVLISPTLTLLCTSNVSNIILSSHSPPLGDDGAAPLSTPIQLLSNVSLLTMLPTDKPYSWLLLHLPCRYVQYSTVRYQSRAALCLGTMSLSEIRAWTSCCIRSYRTAPGNR